MEETIFPPSPSWFLPRILTSRGDGIVSYGSKNNIVILRTEANKVIDTLLINDAHALRVTAVVLSPANCVQSLQDTLVSCSEDGFVKLWRINDLSNFMMHKSHWEQKGAMGKIVCLDWSLANPHHIISIADNNSIVQWDILSNTAVKFLFQKLNPTVIACCPFNEKVLAVGAKSGLVYVINLSKNGDIMYKLRGHDNEIQSLTWCPVPYNVLKPNDIYEEYLLASACQDKEVFIWRAGSDGKCETKIHIPTNSVSKRQSDQTHIKLGNSFSFLALFWSDPYTIYSSSSFGELIYFDIKSFLSNKSNGHLNLSSKLIKQSLNSFKLAHYIHSKGLFAIAGSALQGELLMPDNIEIKSELKFKIQSNNVKINKSLNVQNGHDRSFTWEIVTPKTSSLLWTAAQDRKLVACKSNDSELEIVYNLHTVNGSVYSAVVSPHDPNKLAIAVGDGVIRLWNLTEPGGEVQMFWQKIKDRVMCLAWHPSKDGILAYGTSQGRVGLIDTNSSKPPSVFKPSHPNPIYSLSWGPQFRSETSTDIASKSELNLYAVGDNTLSLYQYSKLSSDPLNLSKTLPFQCKKQTDVLWKPDYSLLAVGNEDGSICLIEPSEFKIVYTLLAYKKLIESIAWHPSSTYLDIGLSPYHGYLTSGSRDNDNEIHVFNCTKEENGVKVEQVATLKGHYGNVQWVSWSPHIGGRLVSTSADGSVQIWDVITQSPLINYTPSGKPMFSVWSPIDSDIILTGCKNSVLCVWRVHSQMKVAPSSSSNMKKKKQKKEKNIQMAVPKEIVQGSLEGVKKVEGNETINVAMAEEKVTSKNVKELKMFSKAWKGDAKDELKFCYSMLKEESIEVNDLQYSLPFLQNENEYKELLKSEEESFKKSNNWTEYYELSLWNGNIKEVVEEKTKTGQLNDFLVSLAPVISPRAWQEACLSYSKSLAEKKFFRKAASYLIVCHKVYEAIQLLTNENLFLEALCIAKNRLPKSDPVLENIIRQYAQSLFKNGSHLKACECYIYLKDYLEVAKVCGKKSQPEYLSLAALAARKCGSADLEASEATNAILKCFEANNFELAQRVCDDHSNLRYLRLMYNMYYTLNQLEGEEICLKQDILTHVKEISSAKELIFPASIRQLYNKYTFYKNKRQMFIVVAQELSFACCVADTEKILTHVIKALSICSRYIHSSQNEVHPLFKLCSWLWPAGFLTVNSYLSVFEVNLLPKVKSVKAFICAAVVRNLTDSGQTDDVRKYLDILSELKDDLLDEESYKYFKNLIEVEICEKRLMAYRDKSARGKVASQRDRETQENGFEKMNGDLKVNANIKNDQIGTEVLEEVIESSEVDKPDLTAVELSAEGSNVSSEIDKYSEFQIDTNLEKIIDHDLELLNKLKTEIDEFETRRISSPNPVPVYFMLKKLCETVEEVEPAKIILEDLEKIWNKLK